uniref:Cytochrome P450 n=1 Tax=Steinernema glaseri TaxID=37863 RepID=A0A1I7Y550_9BILA
MQAENRLSDEDIREEVDTFMFAGHDTTASAIGFTIWLLAQNPNCQAKVQSEVEEIFGDSDRPATSEDLKRLRYLEMCIKESLRMAPPIPVVGRILSEDLELKGGTIPAGVTVVVGTAAVHRDPKNYHNPEEFDPENFSQENIGRRHPYSFIPFAAGPRNCIGQKFAILEEKAVLSTFFRHYWVSTSQNLQTNKALPEVVLTPSKGFMMKVFRKTEMKSK